MPTVVNAFLGRLSIGLILGSTLLLLALNLSGPPGTAGTLNGYGWRDIYAYHGVYVPRVPLLLPHRHHRVHPRRSRAACSVPPRQALAARATRRVQPLRHALHHRRLRAGVHVPRGLGKPHAGLNEPPAHATLSRPAHIILGYMVIIAIFLQCCAGLVKYVQRDGIAPAAVPKGGILAQHGRFGPLVWCCGLVCIVLAVYFEYLEVRPQGITPFCCGLCAVTTTRSGLSYPPPTFPSFSQVPPADKPHWNAGQLAVACVFIVSLGITVLAYLHTGDRAAHDKSLVDLAGEDDGSVDVRGLLQ